MISTIRVVNSDGMGRDSWALEWNRISGISRLRFHALQFVGDDGPARAQRWRNHAAKRRLEKFASQSAAEAERSASAERAAAAAKIQASRRGITHFFRQRL